MIVENAIKEFTIIICTYNGGSRIPGVVRCILQQEDWESYVEKIIIVDNHSTDNTAAFSKQLERENSKVKYIYEEKQGLSFARASGVRNTITEWIVFLDDDNYIQEGWLEGVHRYICNHKNVGAFNGKVIPRTEFKLSKEQDIVLQAGYGGLACSHISDKDDTVIDEGKWQPFGAGLVIRTQPLRRLEQEGWLKFTGRKGNEVLSGEDTEMVSYVKGLGYTFGFCKDVTLYHLIERHRLTEEYILKLHRSFFEVFYRNYSNQPFYVLRRIKHFFRAGAVILNTKFQMIFEKDEVGRMKKKIHVAGHKVYIQNAVRDLLIRK